jgi:hypothetical protein
VDDTRREIQLILRKDLQLAKRKFVGSAEFTTVIKHPDSITRRLLTAWSNVPLLLMLEHDWSCGPLVIIGLSDYMMWPLLPPGTLLRLNKRVRTIAEGTWSEFERPIYLIEHRGRFWCCHAQRKGQSLLLISHAESPCRPSITIPYDEAKVRGQLTAVFRPLAVRGSTSGMMGEGRLNA